MREYRTLFENAKNALFIASPAGKIVDINSAGLTLFGYTKEEATEMALLDLYVRIDEGQKFWREMQQNNLVKDFEAQLHRKDGTVIDGLISVSAQQGKRGGILSYQGMIRDVTKLKRAERDLQAYNVQLEQEVNERTAQFESQIEQLSALNSMMQMVASGRDLQTTLQIVAREMVRIFRASHSEIALINSDWSALEVTTDYSRDANGPSSVGLVIPLTNNPSFTQVVGVGEMVVVSEAQTSPLTEMIHDVLRARNTQCLMILPLLSRGQVIGTIGVDLDDPDREFSYEEVTLGEMVAVQIAGFIENVRLFDEDMHQAYGQLKELDRLKSAFIGVITHELRSPFVAAELSVQLVERYAEYQMFDDLARQIKQLMQELAEGRKMIDNVISFASLVGKEQKLNLQKMDITGVIQEATNPLKEMARTRNINLSFDFDPDLPLVQIDKERMGEAIYHLVYNAIKFNSESGSVAVSCFLSGKQVVLKVQDTGVGLPEEKLATIWEAFDQDADDLKRGIEGLGLGLALVKLAINAHGGQVAATSKPGEGSIFGFRIPIEPD